MARESFDTWEMINVRRMGRQGWSFSFTSVDISESHPSLKISRAVVGRNLDRARRRHLRACLQSSDPDLDV